MRHAIVTETYPPEVNGVALTVHSLEQGLRARGHEVQVVRPRQPGIDLGPRADVLVRGVRIPIYSSLRVGLPCTRRLLRLWREQRPDTVHVATEGPLGWSALRAARRLGIPVTTAFHTRFDQYMRDYGLPWLEPLALRWMRRFHGGAQATLVPTGELAAFLSANRIGTPRLLPRAVDTGLFAPDHRDKALRRLWGVVGDAPLVIHVGRIAAEKNLGLAVSAFRALQRRCPGARLVWVGDGPLRERIEREHPDFVFAGIQRGLDLARCFASADLFLFPSKSETFGNVTLESMACGVPVVAFDYGAAREHLRDGVHGAAIRPWDDTAFIAATVRLGRDPARLRAMGAAARGAVMHLSPQRVAADFDALLAGLTNAGHVHADLAPA